MTSIMSRKYLSWIFDVLITYFIGVGSHVSWGPERRSVHMDNVIVNSTSLPYVNTRGMGYYYTSFYQSAGCIGTPTFQEGYVTGKCLKLASGSGMMMTPGTSIRMDCSATLDGLQVQYFSSSATCSGTVTTMVYPVGSSTGGNCYPVLNTYFSQALGLYNLGLISFKPMCMLINANNLGVPVSPDYAKAAIVESIYQSSSGCTGGSGGGGGGDIFQLPDTFKAFVQTPLLMSYCSSKSTMAQAIAPYNVNAVGQVACVNSGTMFAFAGNFDGACVVTTPGIGSTVQNNKCYGPSTLIGGVSPTIAGNANLKIPLGTLPSLSKSFSLVGSNCRSTCMKIYPRCARPTGQPSMVPTMQPTNTPSTPSNIKQTKIPTAVPTRRPSVEPVPSGQPSMQPSKQPTNRPSIRPTMQPSSEPTQQPTSQPSNQPSGQPSMQPSTQPSQQPTAQPSIQPSSQPSGQPSRQPSQQPTMQPSSQPSSQPTQQPTIQPSSQPTLQPSTQPTMQPSIQPTLQPSRQPTNLPTMQPSRQPTSRPSKGAIVLNPAIQPSGQPTMNPSMQPSIQPTSNPSKPTGQPSQQPSQQPSVQPSSQPTMQPTQQPSSQPTYQPTLQPTMQPSIQPSSQPSIQPSQQPSTQPTMQPSIQPTRQPTMQPSRQPTQQPSMQPTQQPSIRPSIQPTQQPSSYPTAKPTTWTWNSPPNIGGCNTTAIKNCLHCMVAPPGFSVVENYKQYTCLSQAVSSIPSTFPSLVPTSAPIINPTSPSPTLLPSTNLLSYQVSQTLSGIDLPTVQGSTFQGIFKTDVATVASTTSDNVAIVSVAGSQRRILLANVAIVYMVQSANPNLVTVMTSSGSTLTQLLQSVYPSLTISGTIIYSVPCTSTSSNGCVPVFPPTPVNGSPTPSPTSLSSGAIAGIVIGCAVGIVLIVVLSILIPKRQREERQELESSANIYTAPPPHNYVIEA